MDSGMAERESPIPIWIAINSGMLSAYRSGSVVKLQAATATMARGRLADSTALFENRSLNFPQILTESTKTNCSRTIKAVTIRIGNTKRSNIKTTKKGLARLMAKFHNATNASRGRKPASRRGSRTKERKDSEWSPCIGGSGRRVMATTPVSPNKIPTKKSTEYASNGGRPEKLGHASTKNPPPKIRHMPTIVPQAIRLEKTFPNESTGIKLRTSECHAGPGIAAMKPLQTRTVSKKRTEALSRTKGKNTIRIHRSRAVSAHQTISARRCIHRSTA